MAKTSAVTPPPETVAPGVLMAALGVDRDQFMRAVTAGNIPAPLERTLGGHRRWTRAQLPEIVALLRKRKRPVPPGWDQTKTRGGSGS